MSSSGDNEELSAKTTFVSSSNVLDVQDGEEEVASADTRGVHVTYASEVASLAVD